MPKPISEDLLTGNILHKWIIKEYENHQRGVFWYVFMLALGGLLVVYGLMTGNFLFSLIIILAAIILFLQSRQEAPELSFQIAELGIVLGNRFYSYSELENFYIIYQPPDVNMLFFETSSPVRPMLRIPLLGQDPVEIRTNLSSFLDEDIEKEEEPRSETIARRWKIH